MKRERILVLDDDEMVRMVIRAVLVRQGYAVTEAGGGEEAVGKCREGGGGFDLALVDLCMPEMTGYEALSKMREVQPGLKAILLSGRADHGEGWGGEGQEGIVFMQKPFENGELLQLVEEMLERGSERSVP